MPSGVSVNPAWTFSVRGLTCAFLTTHRRYLPGRRTTSGDAITPPEVIDAVKVALQGHEDVEIQVHPGAAHGFSHRSGKYHDEAAEAASLASVIELVRLLS